MVIGMAEDSKCARPRCKRPVELVWLDEPLCNEHWLELCAKDDKRERAELEEKRRDDPVFYAEVNE
jgi:hypothetical protein